MSYPKKYGPSIGTPSSSISSAKMYGRSNDMRYALRMAEVIRVDYERMTCDLAYIQGESPNAEEVPISAAYWSRRGFLGAMPEVGAIAVVGYTASHQNKHTRPLILTFIPNGANTALNFDPLGAIPRNAEGLNLPQDKIVQELAGFYGPTRYKMRKIYPGDILAMSRQGAEMILDTSVRLYDRSGMELILRGEDGTQVRTSMDEIAATSAGRSIFGRVIRNGLNVPTDFLVDGAFPEDNPLFEDLVEAGIIFDDGTLVPDVNGLQSLILPDGRRQSIVTKNGVPLTELQAEPFNERRVELFETSDGLIPSNPAHGFDPDYIGPDPLQAPFITKVDGTLVGNDPYSSSGRSQYGRLLRPALFSTPNDSVGVPRLEVVENTTEGTEQRLAAAKLYQMRRPDGLGELFYAHDKEGHVFFSVPASTSKGSNLGAGRSVEGEFKGSAKIVMGGNKRDNESLDLRTQGGLKWNLGTLNRTKRSLDVTANGGLNFVVRQADVNGDGARMVIQGNYQLAVDGGIGIIAANGDHLEETTGKREIKAESMSVQVGAGDYNENILSNRNITIQGEETESFGQGRSATILSGGETTDILLGNSNLNFTSPAQRNIVFQSAGTHSITSTGSLSVDRRATGTATYAFQAPMGSYSVNLGAGSISLNAGAGSVNISPGAVRLAAPAISLTGSVALGNAQASLAVVGGVPGPSPHIDFVTGLPLTGNPIVRTL